MRKLLLPAMDNRLAIAAQHWSNSNVSRRLRWWNHPLVHEHLNFKVAGERSGSAWAGIRTWLRSLNNGSTYRHAVSVGGGAGGKEMALLENGIVERFTIYEIAEARVQQGRELATERGLEGRIEFRMEDAFANEDEQRFDLVYWDNSLHHMLDTREAIIWSAQVLKDQGVFAAFDAIEPNQYQWPQSWIRICSQVRGALPDRLMVNPVKEGERIPTALKRPTVDFMNSYDPTECADCDAIKDAFIEQFPLGSIRPLGGVIFNFALADIIANFTEPHDADLLRSLLVLDGHLAETGISHYALLSARKS